MANQESKMNPAQVDLFVQLLGQHQLSLFRYVYALVPNLQDAEDIMQEVSRMLWQRFADFQTGSNFFAWSKKIAYFRIMEFRRKSDRRLQIWPDDLLEIISERFDIQNDNSDDRQLALSTCFESLRPSERELITARYTPGINIVELANRLGRPTNSVYKSLGRIRQALLACIERRMHSAAQGAR